MNREGVEVEVEKGGRGGIIALSLGSIVRTLLIIKSTNELVELINDPGHPV